MKIGILGSHGVGKTSLAYALLGALKEKGVNAGLIREFVRECPLPAGTESRNSVAAQAWIIARQLIEEIEASHRYDVVVCDRTVIDNYAYFLWNLKRGPSDPLMVQTVQDVVNNWSRTYDHLFKLPVSAMPMGDNFRSISDEWQKEIDVMIDAVLADKGLTVHRIELAPNSQRVSEVLKAIGLADFTTLEKFQSK